MIARTDALCGVPITHSLGGFESSNTVLQRHNLLLMISPNGVNFVLKLGDDSNEFATQFAVHLHGLQFPEQLHRLHVRATTKRPSWGVTGEHGRIVELVTGRKRRGSVLLPQDNRLRRRRGHHASDMRMGERSSSSCRRVVRCATATRRCLDWRGCTHMTSSRCGIALNGCTACRRLCCSCRLIGEAIFRTNVHIAPTLLAALLKQGGDQPRARNVVKGIGDQSSKVCLRWLSWRRRRK